MCQAARVLRWAGATIFRTVCTRFGPVARIVSTNWRRRATRATTFTFYLGGAKGVPGKITAIRVLRTDALLDLFIVATWGAVGFATIAIAATALVGCAGAQCIPLLVTARRFHGAHAVLHRKVIATGRIVRDAAGRLRSYVHGP